MIKIYIFADSFKHFENSIKEYEKRLPKTLKILKLKPSKKSNSNIVIKEETSEILKRLKLEKGYKIILNPKGKLYNTNEFSKIIQTGRMNYSDIIFVIGGAHGFDYNSLEGDVDLMMGLAKITMPHALALLVLVEQIYRSEMIEKGSNYHK